MREIELSAVRLEDVEFAYPLVGLNLPVSKKEPEGRGAKRTHRCACHLEAGPAVCPYHVVKAQYDFAKGLAVAAFRGADRGSRAWEKRPLCPAASGGAFTKRGFATALGQLVDAYETKEERLRRGKRRVKGHTPRRMGAQWLALLLAGALRSDEELACQAEVDALLPSLNVFMVPTLYA